MKKALTGWTKDVVRPALYKCVTKCAVALALVLLGDRYLHLNNFFTISDWAFTAGLLYFAAAWMNYLHMDGIDLHYLIEGRRKKRQTRRHSTSDIVDFADEHIVSFDELSDEERLVCDFTSNLAAGLIFLIPSLIVCLTR